MVVRMYRTIRECVVSNARIMSETTIQLPEVNAATVTQWYSRRCRAQEKLILKQGIPQPAASMAATEKLPDLQKGTPLQVGTSAQPHIFLLPPNTAGGAKLKPKPQLQAEKMGIMKRKYIKKTETITCSKCGGNRQPPSHRQYFGNWFCEATETQSFDNWRAELQKRGYGKKKRGNDPPPPAPPL
ncbi:uncharacterized protein LOC110014839 [Oryzias latipes]